MKDKISDYSATANSNTDIGGVNIDEGCAPSGINDAIRTLMKQLKDFQQGTNSDPFNGPTNGAHNGTVGATTPAAGAFTTLSSTGNTTLGDASADTVTVNGIATFNASPVISVTDNTNAALRITQLGTGLALRVEDESNPDSTPTVIDASGNVGIGTSSPVSKLHAYGSGQIGTIESSGNYTTSGSGYVRWKDVNGNAAFVGFAGNANNFDIYNSLAGALTFSTNATERARIDSSGNLLVGTTSSIGTSPARLEIQSISGGRAINTKADITTSANALSFNNPNGQIGSIATNGSATSYNTSSDYRLKENIFLMTGALSVVQALKPCTYTWKADGSEGQGFIAHELQAVVPDCVTGEKDAVETYTDEEGNEQTRPVYQGIDTSFLVATLTAAIQEQQALITQLQADVAALKGQ